MENNFNIIKVGTINCYLLKSEISNVLIDTGYKGKFQIILDFLESNGIIPESVGLIVLTYAHYDHVGNASKIKEITGAKVLVHKEELSLLKSEVTDSTSTKPLNIWGKILFSKISSIDTTFNSITPDIIMDSGFNLEDYGFSGRIINTPGHSKGSISVILNSGEAFVGDLAMNGLPLRFGAGEPIFGENIKEIYESWKKLVEFGVHTLYPAHGPSFSINIIKKILSKKEYI